MYCDPIIPRFESRALPRLNVADLVPVSHFPLLQTMSKRNTLKAENKYFKTELALYENILELIQKVDCFTPYDLEVMKTTCALGIASPTHNTVEETGILDIPTPPLGNEVYDAVWEIYGSPSALPVATLSLTRGTNTGFPFFIPGRFRSLADIVLLVTTEYTQDRINKGYNLSDIHKELEKVYGNIFLMYAERTQATAKPIPCRIPTLMTSYNFEPRKRMVRGSDKFSVECNRIPVKGLTKLLISTKPHTQDRATITLRISEGRKKFKYILPIDHSTMDRRCGNIRGKEAVKWLDDKLKCNGDLITEFMIPGYFLYNGEPYCDNGGRILSSGISTTTVLNCIIALGAVIKVLAKLRHKTYLQIAKEYGQSWDFLGWGDDGVLMCNDEWTDLKPLFEADEWKIDLEPVVKYLGTVYEDNERPYPFSRFVQKTLFPEEDYDDVNLFTIAMKARKDMIKDDGAYDQFVNIFRDTIIRRLPNKTPLSKDIFYPSLEEYERCIKYVETNISRYISEVDTILYSAGHGEISLESKQYLGLDMQTLYDVRERYSTYDQLKKDVGLDISPDAILFPNILDKLNLYAKEYKIKVNENMNLIQ